MAPAPRGPLPRARDILNDLEMSLMSVRAGLVNLLLLALLAPAVCAQRADRPRGQSFGISPLELELQCRPGQSVQGSFAMVTRASETNRFSLDLNDILQEESGVAHGVPAGQGLRSCASWITLPAEIEMPPQGRRVVQITARCPTGAKGTYYAYINVKRRVEGAAAPGTMRIGVEAGISVLVALTVPITAPLHVDIPKLEYVSAPLQNEIQITAENTGVWRCTVEGDVLLYPELGGWPLRTGIPLDARALPPLIYPGARVVYKCPLDRPLPAGTYSAQVRLLLAGQVRAYNRFKLSVGASSDVQNATGNPLDKSELDVQLAVEPQLVELDTPPGAKRTVPVRVQNLGDREVSINVELMGVRMEPSGMLTFLEVGPEPGETIEVAPTRLTLAPRRAESLRLQVAVPREKKAGDFFVRAMRLSASAPKTEFHDQWSSAGEYSCVIVAHDPKAPPARLESDSFNVIRASTSDNPTAAILQVRNSGGKVAKLYGALIVERENGQEISHMTVGGTQPELILPGGVRELRMPMPTLDKGKFRVRAELSPGDRESQSLRTQAEFETYTEIPAGLAGP